MKAYYKYMEDVLAGRVLVNKHIIKAVERHYNDLDYGADRGIFFDEKAADRTLEFFPLLKFTKGSFAGKPFILNPHQAFKFALLDGWKRDDGSRRFRLLYDTKARKNGKTEEAAGYAIKSFMLDKEWGSEIYFAATKKDQAKIGFKAAHVFAKNLRKDSKIAAKKLDVRTHVILMPDTDGKIEAVSSDDNKMDGFSPHVAVIDELHAHPTSGVLDVMQTGMGERYQPLIYAPTTAGFNPQSPCAQLQKVCCDILWGLKEDDEVLAIIHTLDDEDLEGDAWENEDLWVKPNPNTPYGTPRMSYLLGQYKKAKNEGGEKEVQFKTKNLNIWTSSFSTWIQHESWASLQREFDINSLKGRSCYGGLDLASVKDLCSLVLFFPSVSIGEPHKLLAWHWCPASTAKFRQENDGVPYMQWAEKGLLHLTERKSTDFRYIKQQVLAIAQMFNLKSIAYDKANAYQLANELEDEGITMHIHGQGFISMNFPTKEFERMVLNKEIAHDGNPMLTWQLSNVALRIDPAGNIKIDKEKSKEKVDGIVATVMAVGEYSEFKGTESVYETRGVISYKI